MGILSEKKQAEKELQQDFKKFVNQKQEKAKHKKQAAEIEKELICEPC